MDASIIRKFGINIYTQVYWESIISKDPLWSTGNTINNPSAFTHMCKDSNKSSCKHIYN